MAEKRLPFSHSEFSALLEKIPTPFYLYDGDGIRDNVRKIYSAFSWAYPASSVISGPWG